MASYCPLAVPDQATWTNCWRISEGMDQVNDLSDAELDEREEAQHCSVLAEVMLGHLRYGTHGGHSEDHCHPLYRRGDRRSRSLLAGNFNMTNASALPDQLLRYGLIPSEN